MTHVEQMDTTPTHIRDLMLGRPDEMMRDKSALWKNFRNNKYKRPFLHGTVGPQWSIPFAEDDRGFKHIASPMPKPDFTQRIVPGEFPPVTWSPTSFDLPMRRDVLQTTLPKATVRTVEEHTDPRFPPKKPVQIVHGTLYHGTGSTDEKVVHGLPNFRQVHHSQHENPNHGHHDFSSHHATGLTHAHDAHVPQNHELSKHKAEALGHAKRADERATGMMNSISHHIAGGNKMILNVELQNRREKPDIQLHQHNAYLIDRLARIRNTVAGVRAAHTPRKLG